MLRAGSMLRRNDLLSALSLILYLSHRFDLVQYVKMVYRAYFLQSIELSVSCAKRLLGIDGSIPVPYQHYLPLTCSIGQLKFRVVCQTARGGGGKPTTIINKGVNTFFLHHMASCCLLFCLTFDVLRV